MSKVALLAAVFYFMCKLLHVKRVWVNLVEILYSVFLYEHIVLYLLMLLANQCCCVCIGDAHNLLLLRMLHSVFYSAFS